VARVGIFSGTFDPIHDGHLLFAQTAMEHLGLDQIAFMPEASPRRKDNVVDVNFRAAMIQKAIEDWPNFRLFLADSKAHDVSQTMLEIEQKFPGDQFFFLMGADVFEHLPDWPGYRELTDKVGLIVALRTEDDGEIVIPLAKSLGLDVEFIASPLASVSSSKIRQSLIDGLPAKGLDDDVAQFINQHQLYQD